MIVIENASPKAPSPSRQGSARPGTLRRRGRRRRGLGREPASDQLEHGPLGERDPVVAVGELAEHPAGEDLLDRAVHDPAGEAGIEVAAEVALRLTARDDALERAKALVDLRDAPLDLRAAGDLAHDHAHEVRIAPPGPQEDRRYLPQLLPGRHAGFLDGAHRGEQLAPRLAEDGLEDLLLRAE